MPSGNTITGSLADSLDSILSEARIVRESVGVMPQISSHETLEPNTGLSWHGISIDQMVATAVTETTNFDNPQQYVDTPLTITPTQIGIHTFITDRVRMRISKVTVESLGGVAQNAIQRKKDEDGLTLLDGATTALCGSGATLTSGYISAAVRRISSNITEPGLPPYYCVLHGYQIRDIDNELTAPVGTYEISEGSLSAKVFRDSFRGKIGSAEVFEDGNITISGTDAKGGVFAKEAVLLVQGRALRAVTVRNEARGGGGDNLYIYDEYAYGERSPGNWLFEIYSDATAPTS